MENKKIGIIGVGGIANSVHIPGIEKCSGAEIYAICDINKDTLKSVGDRLGIPENLRFCDYRELIGCPKVDAVEICTPNYLHVEMALAAAAAKLDALSPLNVLKRGYSFTENAEGKVITSVNDVENGSMVSITLNDGMLNAVVKDKVIFDGKEKTEL